MTNTEQLQTIVLSPLRMHEVKFTEVVTYHDTSVNEYLYGTGFSYMNLKNRANPV